MIIRTHKNKNFTTLDNTPLQDTELSWQAKGMIAYLLSLPDDWEIYVSDLKNRSRNGRDATAKTLNELIKHGYIKRTERREKGQFKGYQYDVYETGVPNTGKPDTVNPNTDNPNTENPSLLNTNYNQILNKPNTNKKTCKYSTEHLRLSSLLADYILKDDERYKWLNGNHKTKTIESWSEDIRKINEIDNRTIKEIEDVIAFSKQHDFWSQNIMSGKKLRDQFSRLYIQMTKEQPKPTQNKERDYSDWLV